jgi:hypothetical protein
MKPINGKHIAASFMAIACIIAVATGQIVAAIFLGLLTLVAIEAS